MKKYWTILCLTIHVVAARSQDDLSPAKAYPGLLFITNGTVHVGNGQVLEHVTIRIENGKIQQIGPDIPLPQQDVRIVDAKGGQVYPGLILPVTDLGLKGIASGVRGSDDFNELGDYNPEIRSIVAYNTDSKFINVLKANGILLAGVTPEGGTISGSSSVVQLDAWSWQDAVYQADMAIHLNLPSFIVRPSGPNRPGMVQPPTDPVKQALEKTEQVKSFFRQAMAYLQEPKHEQTNLKFAALKGLFDRKQKLFVHADEVKQMLIAIDIAREFHLDVVIVGGSESYQIAGLLKQNNIAVVLQDAHQLPASADDDVDQPYKTAAQLQSAGVLIALNDQNEETRYRNLMFNAGTAAAYGLTKEQALQAITLNSARILGIDGRTGSIEVGKDANIIISLGDILDMRTSILTHAFIQGREVSLEDKQTELNRKYLAKYNLN
jgi:imidazolonepropionase-like amidohydrolase